MTASTFFRAISIVTIAAALASLAMPALYSELLGMTASDAATVWTRAFGVTGLGFGIVAWAVANEPGSPIARALAVAILVTFGLNAVFGVIATADGVMNLLGWGFVVFDGLIVLGAVAVLVGLRSRPA